MSYPSPLVPLGHSPVAYARHWGSLLFLRRGTGPVGSVPHNVLHQPPITTITPFLAVHRRPDGSARSEQGHRSLPVSRHLPINFWYNFTVGYWRTISSSHLSR